MRITLSEQVLFVGQVTKALTSQWLRRPGSGGKLEQSLVNSVSIARHGGGMLAPLVLGSKNFFSWLALLDDWTVFRQNSGQQHPGSVRRARAELALRSYRREFRIAWCLRLGREVSRNIQDQLRRPLSGERVGRAIAVRHDRQVRGDESVIGVQGRDHRLRLP